MAYQDMKSKKKMSDRGGVPGGPKVKRKQMPIVDPLTIGKDDPIKERTRKKTTQTEDVAYKAKIKKAKK